MATTAEQGSRCAVPGCPPAWYERLLGLATTLRPGEGRSAFLFFTYAFLLLVCYYVLKTLREPLLLSGSSAAAKSYAYATVALVLLVLVPLYGAAFRRAARGRVAGWITAFFVANLGAFYVAGRLGLDVGFVYYVWVGVFGVTVVAQFWAHATDAFDVESGQRLFPVIMAGATLGALLGPLIARTLYDPTNPWSLLLIATGLLAGTLPLIGWTRDSVPKASRGSAAGCGPRFAHPLGGLALVVRDRYLLLLALLVVLLNCVNTTGEYILTELVVRSAEGQVASHPALDKGALIAQFYSGYFFAMNALTAIAQTFLVARVFRWIGVQGALLVLPVVALLGYGLVVFLPIFSIVRVVKILENSVDYSLTNTARQALYLPLPTAAKYEGKIATDTFFWRCGDLLQAGIIFVGTRWLGLGAQGFALLNMALVAGWFVIALQLAKRYSAYTAAPPIPLVLIKAFGRRRRIAWQPALARGVAGWLALGLGLIALTGSTRADAQLPPFAEASRPGLSDTIVATRWSAPTTEQESSYRKSMNTLGYLLSMGACAKLRGARFRRRIR